jgi:uncharacterized protein YdcH (DUF465 family)
MGQTPRGDLSARLLENNDEYRRLVEEHHSYDSRLEELSTRKFPSEEEKLEELRLKKLKLHLKDRIYGILRQFEQQMAS